MSGRSLGRYRWSEDITGTTSHGGRRGHRLCVGLFFFKSYTVPNGRSVFAFFAKLPTCFFVILEPLGSRLSLPRGGVIVRRRTRVTPNITWPNPMRPSETIPGPRSVWLYDDLKLGGGWGTAVPGANGMERLRGGHKEAAAATDPDEQVTRTAVTPVLW